MLGWSLIAIIPLVHIACWAVGGSVPEWMSWQGPCPVAVVALGLGLVGAFRLTPSSTTQVTFRHAAAIMGGVGFLFLLERFGLKTPLLINLTTDSLLAVALGAVAYGHVIKSRAPR